MALGLIVQVRQEPGYTIVTPAGELDIATVPQLRERLVPLLAGHRRLVIDLDQVTFLDATGLGVLVGAANRADANRTSLHLICSRPQTRRLFHLAGLDRRLPLASTLEEALAAPSSAADMPGTGNDRTPPPGPPPGACRPMSAERCLETATSPQPPASARNAGDHHDGPA
jgi:anti-sigma B factor antagonist